MSCTSQSRAARVALEGRLYSPASSPLAHMHFYPRNSPTTPMMDRPTPPTSIHIALAVGEPVKKREISELNDPAALTPKIISRIPPASSASETALFILLLACCQSSAQH